MPDRTLGSARRSGVASRSLATKVSSGGTRRGRRVMTRIPVAGRRRWVLGAWVLTVGVAASAGWWAADSTLAPPTTEVAEDSTPTYRVATGTVGRTLSFSATASWTASSLPPNSASGTLTSVDFDAGQQVASGDRVYTVDMRPVVVAAGTVPSYRDLSHGAKGPDVEQLQALLRAEGLLAEAPDGSFQSATQRAVKEWQRVLGVERDGIVRRGDVLFLPDLPTRMRLTDGVEVGSQVSPGQPVVQSLGAEPRFVVRLAPEQRDLVPLTAAVDVEHPGGTWQGVIAEAVTATDGTLELVLGGAGDGPVCGSECAELVSVTQESNYRAQIIVVPESSGPVVPAAAMRTSADGQVTVTRADGTVMPVQVVAAADGQAVVSGVDVGEVIALFGEVDGAEVRGTDGPASTDGPTERSAERSTGG